MRHTMRRRWLLAVLCAVAAAWSVTPAEAAACTTATVACTEWLTFGAGQDRTLVYRSHPLGARNESITRALVMVHGAGRDADGYFRTATAAAFLAAALDDTIVLAPRFASSDGRAT